MRTVRFFHNRNRFFVLSKKLSDAIKTERDLVIVECGGRVELKRWLYGEENKFVDPTLWFYDKSIEIDEKKKREMYKEATKIIEQYEKRGITFKTKQ